MLFLMRRHVAAPCRVTASLRKRLQVVGPQLHTSAAAAAPTTSRGSSRHSGSSKGDNWLAIIGGGAGLACAALAWTSWPTGRVAGPRPTDPETLDAVLELLEEGVMKNSKKVGKDILFVDLGSGDGRVVNTVARCFPCRCVGVEVMQNYVDQSTEDAAKISDDVAKRSRFLCADMGSVDLSEVDVLFIYLPQSVLRQVVLNLLPQSGLRKGALLLIEDSPKDLVTNASAFGWRHLRSGGVQPPSSSYPRLDLFEWLGGGFVDPRQRAKNDASGRIPVWST